MAQKVQFIAAVIARPELVILDEPFSGLDPVNVEVLKDAVLELDAPGHDGGLLARTTWTSPSACATRSS